MQARISVTKSLWVRSRGVDSQPVWKSLRTAFQSCGAEVFMLDGAQDTEGIERLRKRLWNSDQHVILHGLMAAELRALRPVFERRKNFSMALIDWWSSTAWFSLNAERLIFHFYNGIALRRGLAAFADPSQVPLLTWPERKVWFEVVCCALRPAALGTWPLVDALNYFRKARDYNEPNRLVYFPLPIDPADVPLREAPVRYDFSIFAATGGYWLIRDPYVSARFNFANLYADRRRLADGIAIQGKEFRVFDRRKQDQWLPWEELSRIVRESRYALSTGGLHAASIPKFQEYVCGGTPVIGATLPFEFPWLDRCCFVPDPQANSPAALAAELRRAVDIHPKLRANCLNLRDEILRLYDAEQLLEMVQGQIDGRGIPAGYLKPEAADYSTQTA
jgi:hypothetical protein